MLYPAIPNCAYKASSQVANNGILEYFSLIYQRLIFFGGGKDILNIRDNFWRGLRPFYLVGLGVVLGLVYGWPYWEILAAQQPPIFTDPKENAKVFGFAEFCTALALLVVIYTITDIRYRFRISIAPLPLYKITFIGLGIIGVLSLLSDISVAGPWLLPEIFTNQSILQGILGGAFLIIILSWVYFAFINPPIFNRFNYKIYARELFNRIINGSEHELDVISSELARSAESLVIHSKTLKQRSSVTKKIEDEPRPKPDVSGYAHDIILLIGTRKLCSHIASFAPSTAMAFFQSMSDYGKANIPISQFSKNISTEAILNTNSIIYHEDEGYASGLIGYIKPFSKAIYGNYKLVEELGKNLGSPFDLKYTVYSSWTNEQFKAYTRAALIVTDDYLLNSKCNYDHTVFGDIFDAVESSCSDLYKLNGAQEDYWQTDPAKRLDAAVDFIKKLIEKLDKDPNIKNVSLAYQGNKKFYMKSLYDFIADLIFEIICDVSHVSHPDWTCWSIQHNSVWGEFFSFSRSDSRAQKIVTFKLRRIIYDEISEIKESPNFKNARLLGLCLNVMGLELHKDPEYKRGIYPLHKLALRIAKDNFLDIYKEYPKVAESCLPGRLSFDEANKQIIKQFSGFLGKDGDKQYLKLGDT